MPRKGQVKVKTTERKEELDALKEKRAEKRARDDGEKSPKKEKGSAKKKSKKEASVDWNSTKPVMKCEQVPLAKATITPSTFPDLSKLKEHLHIGRIRGNDLTEKTHLTMPVLFVPDLSKPNIAQRIRFSLNKKHSVNEPTQFEKKDNSKGKASAKKGKAVDKKFEPWTLNVPIISGDPRDEYICKAISIIYEFCAEQLDDEDLWKTIGKTHLKPNSAKEILKIPVSDQAEGSFWRIKYTWNVWSKHKRFELFDFRGKDESKEKDFIPPSALPSTIKDGNEVDGTFDIDDLYLRPEDQTAGFSFLWAACRLYNGDALKVGGSFVVNHFFFFFFFNIFII
jgi:hypothetical protein